MWWFTLYSSDNEGNRTVDMQIDIEPRVEWPIKEGQNDTCKNVQTPNAYGTMS